MPPFRSLRCVLIVPLVLALGVNAAHGKSIFGWIERVKLLDGELTVEAKLDTGADTSSLNAPDAEVFEKDDEEWVRFSVKDADDNEHTFERPLERMVRIRSAAGTTRRPVVKIAICLGDAEREAEVNLADRGELSYQMLIGRNYLKGHILVDSEPKHTRDPTCGESTEGEEGETADEDGGNDANGNAEQADDNASEDE